MTNTINRAELTGIAAALNNQYTRLQQTDRKQALIPEMQRAHIHLYLLEQIVTMIYASPEPICFYKVKAHSGIAGNECADAIAKHSALHDDVMTCTCSLQLQTVMHTHTFTGVRLKTPMRIPTEEGQLHLGFVHSLI
jgi:hypothetical protein